MKNVHSAKDEIQNFEIFETRKRKALLIVLHTMTLKTTDMLVMPMMLAQYGSPITAFSATHGVNIVTAKFSKLRIM